MINIKKFSTLATAAAALLSFLPAPAQARIGETKEEVEARYGTGTPMGHHYGHFESTMCYSPEGFGIKVVFNETTNRSEMEVVSASFGNSLSKDALDALMKANGGGKAWSVKDSLARSYHGHELKSGGLDKTWLKYNPVCFSSNDNVVNKRFEVQWLSDGSLCAVIIYDPAKTDFATGNRTEETAWKVAFMTNDFAKIDQEKKAQAYRDEKKRKEKAEADEQAHKMSEEQRKNLEGF